MIKKKQTAKPNDPASRMGQFMDEGSDARLRKMPDGELAWFQNAVMSFIESADVDGAAVNSNTREEAIALLKRILDETRKRKSGAKEPLE